MNFWRNIFFLLRNHFEIHLRLIQDEKRFQVFCGSKYCVPLFVVFFSTNEILERAKISCKTFKDLKRSIESESKCHHNKKSRVFCFNQNSKKNRVKRIFSKNRIYIWERIFISDEIFKIFKFT